MKPTRRSPPACYGPVSDRLHGIGASMIGHYPHGVSYTKIHSEFSKKTLSCLIAKCGKQINHSSLPAFFFLLFVFFSVSSSIFPFFLLLLSFLLVFVLSFVFLPDHRNVQRNRGRRTWRPGTFLLTVASFWRPGKTINKIMNLINFFIAMLYVIIFPKNK